LDELASIRETFKEVRNLPENVASFRLRLNNLENSVVELQQKLDKLIEIECAKLEALEAFELVQTLKMSNPKVKLQ